MELKSEILKYTDTKGRLLPYMYQKIPYDIKQLCLENNVTLPEYYHMVRYGYTEYPHCLHCGKRVEKFWRRKNHFYCSKSCSEKSGHANEVRMKTCQKKYGCVNISQLDDIKQKKVDTCIEHFGVMWPQQSKEVIEKAYKTDIERYGVHRPALNKDVVDKQKNTCIEKYGGTSYGSSNEFKDYIKKHFKERFYKQNMEKLLKNNIEILTSKQDYPNCSEIEYKCNVCGNVFKSKETNEQRVHCPVCINSAYSKAEKEVLSWIKSIYSGEIIENDRTILNPKELDIYIPEKKLAIEYNGSYWHSTEQVSKNYHQEKSLQCKEKGVRLIHIFEWEWVEKKDVIQSIIKSALGIYDKKLYARVCNVYPIMQETYRDFLEENHLQGAINSSIRFGLFTESELVAVIGFGFNRFSKEKELELHRYCNKKNYQILGGFSKMLKHSGITSFNTYVDIAHFSGMAYEKTGFKIIGKTEPNYKWVKGDEHLNRLQCQKHKLHKLLEVFDEKKTEIENMTANGYVQVFDSGNFKLHYEN